MPNTPHHFSINRRNLIIAGVFLLALYVMLPQLSLFHKSWHILGKTRLLWLLFAVIATLLTYFFAALTYKLLAFLRLRYFEVLPVQFAAMLFNRLLPAGVGALGANFAYLRHRRHSKSQAATVVATNNLLGIIGNSLIIIVVLILSSAYSRQLVFNSERRNLTTIWIIVSAIVLAAVLIFLFARRRAIKLLNQIIEQVKKYARSPQKLIMALVSSMLLTSANILCFHFCISALHMHLSVISTILVFTIGVGAGTITPTPGGLGGFEAGMVAGLLAYNVSTDSALAITLLYRLVSYWLMLFIGFGAFIYCQHRQLFKTANE